MINTLAIQAITPIKRKAGKPTVITPDTLRILQGAFMKGCNDKEACLMARISLSALYYYQDKNPLFVEQKNIWKESPALKARSLVVEALDDKNLNMATWYLERKLKNEFSIRAEITGSDGKDLISFIDDKS